MNIFLVPVINISRANIQKGKSRAKRKTLFSTHNYI